MEKPSKEMMLEGVGIGLVLLLFGYDGLIKTFGIQNPLALLIQTILYFIALAGGLLLVLLIFYIRFFTKR